MALLAGTGCVLLAIAEGLLRAAGFKYGIIPETLEFGYPEPEEFERTYVWDDDLFWVHPDYPETLKVAGQADVVFQGGSCTLFGGMDRFIASKVSERFPGRSFSYVNCGEAGRSSYQGLVQLERDVLPLRPRVVTFYYGWSDHQKGFGIEDKDVTRYRRSFVYKLPRLRLIQLICKGWDALTGRERDLFPNRVSQADYRRNLTQMARCAKAHGITPVFITAASAYIPQREPANMTRRWARSREEVYSLHQAYVAITREVARAEDVVLCDLAARFDALPRERVIRELFMEDACHFLEAGNRLAAQFLFECFDENGLLEPILRPAEEARHFPGRELRFGIRRRLVEGDPTLPTRLEISRVEMDADCQLVLEGWVLSPKVVDYVVAYINGENIGIARYPRSRPEIHELHPEYDDASSGFLLRPGALASNGLLFNGRLEVYSGDERIAVCEFAVEP